MGKGGGGGKLSLWLDALFGDTRECVLGLNSEAVPPGEWNLGQLLSGWSVARQQWLPLQSDSSAAILKYSSPLDPLSCQLLSATLEPGRGRGFQCLYCINFRSKEHEDTLIAHCDFKRSGDFMAPQLPQGYDLTSHL